MSEPILRGFAAHHESEAIEGALPRDRNNPRRPPLGLYAEQVNGTSFTVPRARNRRAWLYRIRPSTASTPWREYPHATFGLAHLERRPEIELRGWKPRPIPRDEEFDFIEGMATYGGAGDPALRRGFAAHQYVATRSMGRRAFVDTDGDLLLLPDTGRLRIFTELGALTAQPGKVVLLPRALVFKVDLLDGPARGYVFEAYARGFELPERGPIGANATAEARHFEAPTASYEEDDEPYPVISKHGGVLYETERAGSPFDVVAWHGNLVPYRYDLSMFCPVGTTRFDHPDPSVYTVLSAPLDHPGENTVDLVVFPERWDVTEDTFRPPFFHRNAATELNGIVQGREADRVFARGGLFLTPPHAPHGVPDDTVEHALAAADEEANRPAKLGRGERWIQLESTFPMQLSPWALEAPHRDPRFGDRLRGLKKRFQPG